MSTLSFDEDKGFDSNLEEFIKHVEKGDAELGKILRDHISELKDATYESARYLARNSFNAKVVASLDELIAEKNREET